MAAIQAPKGYWMTEAEIKVRQCQRKEAEKAPLYMRLSEWPICLLMYGMIGVAAPFILFYRFILERRKSP